MMGYDGLQVPITGWQFVDRKGRRSKGVGKKTAPLSEDFLPIYGWCFSK